MQARSIVVSGRVDGNLYGIKRVELKKSAAVAGDIYTQRIAIEDGAQLKGSVLLQKDIPHPQNKLAEVTVKQHVSHVLEKLNVRDRTEAATAAVQRGIISLE